MKNPNLGILACDDALVGLLQLLLSLIGPRSNIRRWVSGISLILRIFLLGDCNANRVVSFADVTKSTGTDLVWLVMLAFFISRGVIKTGLGRRIALLFMRLLGKRTVGLGYGLVLTELIISPAMPSITARAGGVMLPITRTIAEVLGSHPDDLASRGKVGNYLILCAFHANIVAAGMFITAMAGNPLAVKLAADHGVSISWLDWAVAASVPGLLCLAIIPLAMLWIAPPQVRSTPDATALAQRELLAMGSISAKEIIMAVIFVGLLVLWIFGEDLAIGATLAAALGVSLLFITGVLTWQDALNEKSAWDTMIWIGLLIMLASKLNEYGMVSWFDHWPLLDSPVADGRHQRIDGEPWEARQVCADLLDTIPRRVASTTASVRQRLE